MKKDLGIVGTVARFKPVHKAHQAMLESICERARFVYMGIGSSNVYDVRSPFTYEESKEMIYSALWGKYTNYLILEVPDLFHGEKWKNKVLEIFGGEIDNFVTANVYVENLLKDHYRIIHPATLIPDNKKYAVSGTMIRVAMAKGEEWEGLVPNTVVGYIKENKLDERFRREFGLETLAKYGLEELIVK